MALAGGQIGLRERQKAERRALLLSVARDLFETIGYDATTMAKVADRASVSTPTVFNYFGSKDDLMLAIIWEGHQESRTEIAKMTAPKGITFDEALFEFFDQITMNSLQIAGKRVWRYAEATNIRRPKSEFAEKYSTVDHRLLDELTAYLDESGFADHLKKGCGTDAAARVVFNHWNALFLAFIKDDEMSIAQHRAIVREDMVMFSELVS